jgi:Flp pilus assembly protein TadD/transglutaminase-like putative cysteine protease
MSERSRTLLVALLACLFAAFPLLSQQNTDQKKDQKPASSVTPANVPATKEANALDVKGADAKDAKKDATDAPPDYNDEAVVVEKMRREFRYENDGTGVSTTTARIRVQTQSGVQQLGQLVFGYNSANEKFDITYLRVVKQNHGGTINATDANFQDVPSQVEREAPSYTDFRERHVTVPALRPGDTLEYEVKTTVFTPLIPKHFWFEYSFRKELITLNEELELNLPADRKFTLKNKPEFAPKVHDEKGRKVYTWSSNYLKRETDEELKKRRRREARKDFVPDIQLSTFQSWEELGAWFASLQRPQMEPSAALKAKVAELTKDLKTDEEKTRAIYDYVAQDYRYVSLSFGVGRYQPHDAQKVFENKYGDCKDKHTLFSAMMKVAGLKVNPVLISASARKLDPDVPSPAQFDHVISLIGEESNPTWVDTTTEIAPFAMLSFNIRNKKALLAALDGKSHVIETPADPPFQSKQLISVEGKISDLGKLTGTVKSEYRGDQELGMRVLFRQVPQNKWKDVAEYISYQAGIGGEASDVKIGNLTDTTKPFTMSFNVSRPNFLDWANKSTELRLPLPAMMLAPAGGAVADDDDDDEDGKASEAKEPKLTAEEIKKEEEKPIELGSPYELRVNLNLQLPATHKSRTPVPLSIRRDYGEYKSSYKVEGQQLTVERVLNMKVRELPAARRSDYQAFTRTVRTDEAQKFYVESLNASAGAPTLPTDIKADELIDSARDALQSQNYRIALELLKRAAEKEPKSKKVYNLLGDAYMGNRQFTEAEAAYRKQISIDTFDQFAHSRLARSLWAQRKLEDSAKVFQEQLEINPLDSDATEALGEVLLELKKYEDAVPVLERAVSLEPENAISHSNLGRAYLNVKRDKDAAASFDKAVELQPNPLLWNNIAYELAQSNSNLDKAQEYAESALASVTSALRNVSVEHVSLRDIASVSALGSYWDTLGWVAFKKGEMEKAKKYIEASWRLSHSAEVGDHLAQIYEKEGKREEAIRLYAQALSAERPVPDTKDRLAKLAGSPAKVDELQARHKAESQATRTFKFKSGAKPGKADFFVVLASGSREPEVKFISGADDLKALAVQLKALNYGVVFPDSVPTKVVRRGTLDCATAECTFVLQVPETITSVN